MSHDHSEVEPIPGLPAKLPEGEHILWQGSPDRRAFLDTVLKIRWVFAYVGAVLAWNIGTAFYDGKGFAEIILGTVLTVLLGAMVYAMAYWFAKAVENSTIYTITNKRVVMRFGIAIRVTFNLPFSQMTSADVKVLDDQSGSISLTLKDHTKISWAILWPHARPWKFANPCPTLRAVKDVKTPADILAQALSLAHGQAPQPFVVPSVKAAKPAKAQPQLPVGAMPAEGG